jgi:hypothetical protein
MDEAAKYASLVRFVLRSYDTTQKLAQVPEIPDLIRGMEEAERAILEWATGLEGTDLEGLREKFKEES